MPYYASFDKGTFSREPLNVLDGVLRGICDEYKVGITVVGALAFVRNGYIMDVERVDLLANIGVGVLSAIFENRGFFAEGTNSFSYGNGDYVGDVVVSSDDSIAQGLSYLDTSGLIVDSLDGVGIGAVELDDVMRQATAKQLSGIVLPDAYKARFGEVLLRVKNNSFTVDGKPIWKIYS